MKIINLAESHSVINQFVAELRDVHIQKDRMRFRRNLERIGELMAYEVSRTLTYSDKAIEAPFGVARASTPDDEVVVATVFRAGLPLHAGFLHIFDRADSAFVSARRRYERDDPGIMKVEVEYVAAPDLDGKTLIIADPMLATGESMGLAWKGLLTRGTPKALHLACVTASRQGVDYLRKSLEDVANVTLWCAAIDPGMNSQSYIVPGMGDTGDLAFGDKRD